MSRLRHLRHLRHLRRLASGERGSITAWAAISAVAMILVAGLVVDLGGQIRAEQRAHAVAAEAARVAGQQLQGSAAVRGDRAAVDVARGAAAARSYLEGADVEGNVSITGGDTITVSTSTTYTTQFLGIAGISQLPASGQAEAQTIRTLAGGAQ